MFNNRSLQAAGLATLLAASALAQDSTYTSEGRDRTWRDILRRSSISIAFNQTRPQGALARNIGLGYGASGAYVYRLDADGVWSIRADVAAAAYGNESKRSAFSETVGGRVQVNTRTTNYIIPVFVGPQLAWPTGVIRPYVNAGVGAQTFVTESSVGGTNGYGAIASSTNQIDATFAWVAGGGLEVQPALSLDDEAPCDVLVLPGGYGTRREMHNAVLLAWIRRRAEQVEVVLSICTGALLLARAGLLDGVDATTHHLAFDELAAASPTTHVLRDSRTVDNGRIVTSAGISAGIDASLDVVAKLLGHDIAAETAAYMEYDWRDHT